MKEEEWEELLMTSKEIKEMREKITIERLLEHLENVLISETMEKEFIYHLYTGIIKMLGEKERKIFEGSEDGRKILSILSSLEEKLKKKNLIP